MAHPHPVPLAYEPAVPDFVVVDVGTVCSSVGSICRIGIAGFWNGVEVLRYETLVDPLDRFLAFNTRIHGITCDHVTGAPTFGQSTPPSTDIFQAGSPSRTPSSTRVRSAPPAPPTAER